MAKFKQACFAHDLSKKVQIFAAVHKSNVLNSAAKILLSNLSPNLSAYAYSLEIVILQYAVVQYFSSLSSLNILA